MPDEPRWVTTWASAPQLTEPGDLPPAPYTRDGLTLAGSTLRQTVRVSAGGPRIRLRLSNAFGGAPLRLTHVLLALPRDGRSGERAVRPGTSRPVTFHGRTPAVVPPGAHVVSDPLDLDVPPRAVLTVTLHLAGGHPAAGLTSHPGSRTTSHLAPGDQAGAADLTGATPVDHWYLLSGVETWSTAPALALLGDSLTDGRGSTTNGDDRWPDRLLDRLPPGADAAVVNQAAGGNRVLADGLGPAALSRLDRDVLAQSGVDRLLVFEGVNDLGTAPPAPDAQKDVAGELIAAYHQIVVRAQARGMLVYGATLTPFGGHVPYDDPDGHREAARQEVNAWIRGGGAFDAVVDFDRAARDPADPRRLRPAYDEGDHLHLNPAGYRALAAAFPLDVLTAER
ncbi:SGNH/GDSL hydrolase family protein [Nonomuraea sp. NPDC003214]